MSRQLYIDFLRSTEQRLDWLAICEPAWLSPAHQPFVRTAIASERAMLTVPYPQATEEETRWVKQLLHRLDDIERHHFGEAGQS